MRIRAAQHNSSTSLFTALLLMVFILCSIFTILIGCRVYINIYTRNDTAFYTDTALSYISNKVRQADRAGCISVRRSDGCDVLVLTSDYEGTLYETWIYTKDGFLRELFSEKNSGLTIDDGLIIMDCGTISFSLLGNDGSCQKRELLRIQLEDDSDRTLIPQNTNREALLSLRSSQNGGFVE